MSSKLNTNQQNTKQTHNQQTHLKLIQNINTHKAQPSHTTTKHK